MQLLGITVLSRVDPEDCSFLGHLFQHIVYNYTNIIDRLPNAGSQQSCL